MLPAINQPIHFSDELNNEEKAATQVQQALITSREIARQEPYVPFKGKCVIKDDELTCVAEEEASLSVREVGGSSNTLFEQEPWDPPSPTPSSKPAQVTFYIFMTLMNFILSI